MKNKRNVYDYIVVGGGSAGCVVAARLSENPNLDVLLLEAGGPDTNPLISIPLGMGKLHQYRMHDWGFDTEAEPNLNGRKLEAMRGKVMGGSSSINVMAYTRGHRDDFDRWDRQGAKGWSYEDVLPYFRRGESFEGGSNIYRGGDGPVGTQFAKTPDPIFDAWANAGVEAGFRKNDDYNDLEQEGFGRAQFTIRDGRRSSSSRAYIKPISSRQNLTIKTRAHVTSVHIRNAHATGVNFMQGGQLQMASVTGEVILAGGAFNTPQILMLSGLGPAEHLKQVGITPILDVPGIGKNLQDHLGIWITWKRKSPGRFHREMRFDRMAMSILRAYFAGTGPGTIVPGGLHAFVKVQPDSAVPDTEFMFHTVPPQTKLWFPGIVPAYQDAYAIRPTLLHPKSRGELLLRSADPLAAPRIHFNFFSEPDDLRLLVEGFKMARVVGQQPAMEPYRDEEMSPGPLCITDEDIISFIRRTALTAHHPCGSCRMGADNMSPLDPQMRLKGIEGLRVVDASAMPDLVSAHINACVLMMGEKAADLIRSGVK